MRIPVSVLRSIQVGLAGSTLALAVGCSQPAAANKDPAPETKARTVTEDDAKPGSASRPSDTSRSTPQAQTAQDDRQVPGSSWFLSQPGQPQTNQPTQPVSEQQPVVVQVQPKPKPIVHQPNPNPKPNGNWNVRAACGRG